MVLNKIFINIPIFFDLLIIKNSKYNNILLINKKFNKHVIIRLDETINLYLNNNNIIFNYKNKIIINFKNLENKFENFLKLMNIFLYKKIKFKGKGYKITFFKKKKLIKFFFNHSHKTIIKLKGTINISISKNKFILLDKNNQRLNNLSKIITKIRDINLFTLRGLRTSKKIIFKRKGKKSSYI